MSPWRLLRAHRSPRAALGYQLQRGAATTVHYSTAPAAPAGGCTVSGSWSPSSEKQTMQQLNLRLASYLQQVELLEATNRRLEREIQEELKRRSPTEMKELDGLLRSASFLQEQIGDCLTARGLLNLQLLACELAIFDLNSRCEQEREQRGRVEADLGDLRYLHEVLKFHKLPELQEVLREQRQELQELQERHLQDEQALLNQVSGGVAVAMQTAESSDLIQQLDVLRQISAAESWTEVPILQAPDVTFDLAASSEVAELEHLRRTSTNLTEDLKHLQRETAVLEASGRQQTENFMVQLTVLQETADHLCLDLDSVLQAAAQQAADHQALLDVKSRLEAEIQDYMRLLDSLSHQGASVVHFNSKPAASCFTVSRETVPIHTPKAAWGRRSNVVQMVSSAADHNMRPKKMAIISRNSSNQSHSFQTSLSRTGWESNSHTNLISAQNSSPVQSQAKESDQKAFEPQTSSSILSDTKPSQTIAPLSKPQNSTFTKTEVKQIVSNEIPKVMERLDLVTDKSKIDTVKPSAADTMTSASTEIFSQATNINPTQNISQESVAPQEVVREGKMLPESVKLSETQICESTIKIGVSDELNPLDDKGTRAQDINDQVGIKIEDVLSSEQSPALTEVSESQPNMEESQESRDYSESQAESGESLRVEVNKVEIIEVVEDPPKANTESASQEDAKTSTIVMDSALSSSIPQTLPNEDIKDIVSGESVQTPGQSLVESDVSVTESKVTQEEVIRSDVVAASFPSLDREDNVQKETESVEISKVEVDEEEVAQKYDVKKIPAEDDDKTVDPLEEAVLINRKESKISTSTCDSGVDLSPAEALTLPETHFSPADDQTKMNNKDVERQVKREEEETGSDVFVDRLEQTLRKESNSEPERLMENKDLPVGSEGKETHSAGAGSVNVEVDVVEEQLTDSKDGLKDSVESDNELVELSDQRESKRLASLSDSGIALSFSSKEDNLSPTEPMISENQAVSLEMSLSPAEELMSLNDPMLFPVDLDENDAKYLEMFPSLSDPETCLSPEVLPVNEEDDDDACQSLTEAIAHVHVRPVEKYVLSTKDEDKVTPETDKRINTAEEDKFKVFEGSQGSKVTQNVIKRQISWESSLKEGSSGGGLESGGSNIQNIIADKEKQLGFGGLYRKPVRTAGGSPGVYQSKGDIANRVSVSGGTTSTSKTADVTAGGVTKGSGEWLVYGGSLRQTNGNPSGGSPLSTSQPKPGRFGSGEWIVYGGNLRRKSSLDGASPNEGNDEKMSKPGTSAPETGRFGRRGSGGSDDWLVYGGRVRHKSNEGLTKAGSTEHLPPLSPPETGRFGRRSSSGSEEWLVYGGSVAQKSKEGLTKAGSKEHLRPMSPPETGRFAKRSSSDWIVYGGTGGDDSRRPEGSEHPTAAMQLSLSPPGSMRFGSGSGEWRVYGGSGRLSGPAGSEKGVISPPGSYTGRGPRPSNAGGRLTSGGVLKRSSSVGSGGRLSSSSPVGSQRISGTGSVDTKPVYSSAGGHRSSSAGTGQPSGGSQRAQSPAGRLGFNVGSGGTGGWLHSSAGGHRANSSGSGSRGSTGGSSSDRISGGRVSGSSGSGRVKSTGGRVISSSDRPIRSTGSGSGGHKERISVCKMAALLMSAAGRERSKDKQKKKQQQQQQATAATPLVQRWLTTGVGVTSADAENTDDIMSL
uniref:IF rod domain-containing protein n=1 Tax=Salarias fasciatus TaxID=181472 RepID=A0A672F4I8_SALFA